MQKPKKFSDAEFVALAETMRLRSSSSSCKALRRVLVDGESIERAAMAERYYERHLLDTLASAKACVQRVQLLQGVQIPAA